MVVSGYQFIALDYIGKVTAFSNIFQTLDEAKFVGRNYTAQEDICDTNLPYWFILGPYAIYDIEGAKLSEDRADIYFQMLSDVGDWNMENGFTIYHPIPYLFDRSPIPRFGSKYFVAVVQWPESGENPKMLKGEEAHFWGDALKKARLMHYVKSEPGPVFRGIIKREGPGAGILGHMTFGCQETIYNKRGKIVSTEFDDSMRGVYCYPSVSELEKCGLCGRLH